MKNMEWRWKASDGLEFYSCGWIPEGKTKAVLILVHGMGEHTGRYSHVAAAMCKQGYALVGFDLRGHGKSGGKRGHTPSLERLFDDLDGFFAQVEERFPSIPKYIYGHSIGGAMVLAYTPMRHPKVNGSIVTGIALSTAVERQKAKVMLAKILGTLMPGIVLTSGLDENTLSRDPMVVQEYVADPMVHDQISTGWGKAMLDVNVLAKKTASLFPVPVLVMHGSEDQLCYPTGSKSWAALAPKEKCSLKIWDGLYHEIHNEPEKDQVIKYMINWLDSDKNISANL